VFVVATANNIEALPPELLRKGRFDEVFFVDLPSSSAREEILRIHIGKKGRDPAAYDLPKLAGLSRGFSGAELEEAVREGMFDAFASQRELATDHIARAIEATYPLSRTMREAITGLREWAKARARLASNELVETLPDDAGTAVPVLKQERRNPFARPEGRGAT
jgi:SpoVK/Ycf46/Vps4 family AAA+-type ATPase